MHDTDTTDHCPHCGGPARRGPATTDPDGPTALFCRSTGSREDRPDLHAVVVDHREAMRAEKRAAIRAVQDERARRAARSAAVVGSWNARALGIIR